MPPLIIGGLPLIAQLHAGSADLGLLMDGQRWEVTRQALLHLEVVRLALLLRRGIAALVKQPVDLRSGVTRCVVETLALLDRLGVIGSRDAERRVAGGRVVLQGRI